MQSIAKLLSQKQSFVTGKYIDIIIDDKKLVKILEKFTSPRVFIYLTKVY